MCDLVGAKIKFEVVGDNYAISIQDLSKEQFDNLIKDLGLPIIFIGGNLSQPALDSFQRGEDRMKSNWSER